MITQNRLIRKQIENNNETCESEKAEKNKLLAQKRFEKTGGVSAHVSITRLEKKGYCVLDLDEENCEEFKSKAPDLYDKIYQEAKKEGVAEGKEIAEISRKARLKAHEKRTQIEKEKKPKTLKEKYDNSPELQEEFDDFETYEAYERNVRKGNIRTIKKEGVAEGKEIAEISRKARLKVIETKNQTEVNPEEPKSIKEKYDNDPELQEEFRTFEVYEAYEKNLKAGNIKILKKKP